MRPKTKQEFPIALTADGRPFSHSAVYYFFDGENVRTTEGLRRIDQEHLGSFGLRVVPVAQLREKRDDALSDAQRFYLKRIEASKDEIRKLESLKTANARSLKSILMANE